MGFLGLDIAQGVIGLGQSIVGGIQAHKAQKQLENMAASYKPNSSLLDYYNKALSRYNVNPYESATYRRATQDAQRNLNTGVGMLQDRRSALAGIGGLVQGANDSNLKAAAEAEREQGSQLGQLGQAAQVKAAEEFKPFEMKYNLLGAKAAGGNQLLNAGAQNLFGAAQNASNLQMARQAYGDNRISNSPITNFPIQ